MAPKSSMSILVVVKFAIRYLEVVSLHQIILAAMEMLLSLSYVRKHLYLLAYGQSL